MSTPVSQAVEIAGDGVASDYARRLLADLASLADLGFGVRSTDGPPDPDPSVAWATSGAMALTGRADGLPRAPAGPIAACASGVARALAALGGRPPDDAPALLGERAAHSGLTRRGATSPGGACRLLRTADGFAALNLARPDDERALPAWLDATPPGHDVDAWSFAAAQMQRRTAPWLAERANWLGIAFAPSRAADRSSPWLRLHPIGPRGTAPPTPRVVDFSSLWAGPLCTQLLADAGADVVKVESRSRPDGARLGAPGFFDQLHAGKRSVQLDFAGDRDRALLFALVESADVVVESTRPRALAQLGIDAEAWVGSRAGRVWVSLTGYGREDPAPGRVAFGDDAGVAAGLAESVADDAGPIFCGDAIADPLTGLHAALAAWAAWRHGGGVLLDLALRDVAAHAHAFAEVAPCEVSGEPDAARVEVRGVVADVATPRARPPRGPARPAGADTGSLRRALRVAC